MSMAMPTNTISAGKAPRINFFNVCISILHLITTIQAALLTTRKASAADPAHDKLFTVSLLVWDEAESADGWPEGRRQMDILEMGGNPARRPAKINGGQARLEDGIDDEGDAGTARTSTVLHHVGCIVGLAVVHAHLAHFLRHAGVRCGLHGQGHCPHIHDRNQRELQDEKTGHEKSHGTTHR